MNNNDNKKLTTIIYIIILSVVIAMAVVTLLMTTTVAASTVMVQAGGGNKTTTLTQFIPQTIEIKVGDNVTWYNPSQVVDPHTVSFVLDNKTMAYEVVPFLVTNSSKQFTPLPPTSNSQPIIIPGKNGTNTLIALNARVFSPTVIDSSGNAKVFLPNAAYTLNGTEKYVNSGFLLPKGKEQGFPGSSNAFTVTFKKAGTYNYSCLVYPWMHGSVKVK